MAHRAKVVIIGAGFGGLAVANGLKGSDFDVTIIDRTNHHLFQPLLYQVATAALSPGDIAMPIRSVFRRQNNISVLLAEVIAIDAQLNLVHAENSTLPFDFLVVATGTQPSYFGHDQWATFAPGLKTLEDALTIRENMLLSLEKAEHTTDLKEREKYTNFVIVGGGPTGVEMAGSISEIAQKTMVYDYRNLDTSHTNIYLVEAGEHILAGFPDELSQAAQQTLERMGVRVLTNTRVTDVTEEGVQTSNGFIPTSNTIWAAGNTASPLLQSLGVVCDQMGRAVVEPDMSIPAHEHIFVIGDAACVHDSKGKPLPGVAPVALQQGKYIAGVLKQHSLREQRPPFRYTDKGSMATIGRAKAVADIRGLKFTGIVAWLLWSFIHIFFLIGFRNRFRVMAEWVYYYLTFRRGIRLIIGKVHPQRLFGKRVP